MIGIGELEGPAGLVEEDERGDDGVGDSNVSVKMRGLKKDCRRGRSLVHSTCSGGIATTRGGLSPENRSSPCLARIGLRVLFCNTVFLTVPSSNSSTFEAFSYSSINMSITGCGCGDIEEARFGRTEGADMSPIHSTAMTGTLMMIS